MSKIKLDYICRLATVSDLDNILEVFHIYNDDEALAKAINMNMRGSSELNQSIIDLIDTGCVMVAINSDNSEVYGFSIFYEKSGLDPSTIKGSLLETVEEDAVKTCQELGLETLAPIVSVCNICMDVTSIWPEKFVYLEAIGVKPQYRGMGVATALVKELQNMKLVDETVVLRAVATSIGTEKALRRLGWVELGSLQVSDFTFKGVKSFANLDLEIKSFKKTLQA